MKSIGVISDTHGLLRPQALSALQGSDLIIHAGDVGDPAILAALGKIAPVLAVRGNIDRGAWAGDLPARQIVQLEEHSIYVLHDLYELDLAGRHRAIEGVEHLHDVINIDQSPIGRVATSIPATYIGVYDAIRELFAATPEARDRGGLICR